MVKAYTQQHIYKHPWERVSCASWRKFADPENKRILSHVLDVDTLNHSLDPSSGKLYTTRAITIHCPGPWFVRRIIGQDICHCVESTVVDAQSRSMQLTSRNISLQNFIEVEEKIRYDPHPDNPTGWTICQQETRIRIKPLSALASMAEKVEQRCAEKFLQNSVKGREVMERICKYLEAESSSLALWYFVFLISVLGFCSLTCYVHRITEKTLQHQGMEDGEVCVSSCVEVCSSRQHSTLTRWNWSYS